MTMASAGQPRQFGRPAGSGGNTAVTGAGGPRRADTRLVVCRNPLRLAFSAAPWVAAGYLASYLVVSVALFGVAIAAVTATAALAITLAGIPLLVAAACAVRGCANVERGVLRLAYAQPVRGGYRRVLQPGIMAQVRTRWRDPATWRDLVCLTGLWAPLFALGTIVLSTWLVIIAGMTLPLWYWAPTGGAGIGYVTNNTGLTGARLHGMAIGYFPHGPRGPGAVGLYVDNLPRALLAAAGSAVLFLIFNYVLVLAARAHATVCRSLLRAPADPLAAAREVLSSPGPLGPLHDQHDQHDQHGTVVTG